MDADGLQLRGTWLKQRALPFFAPIRFENYQRDTPFMSRIDNRTDQIAGDRLQQIWISNPVWIFEPFVLHNDIGIEIAHFATSWFRASPEIHTIPWISYP